MSSVELLDKTRKINRLLHNNSSSKVAFNDICAVLREVLDANAFVISRKGKILGRAVLKDEEMPGDLMSNSLGSFIDAKLNERLLSILSTKENLNLELLGFDKDDALRFGALVTPVNIAGKRFGTLFIYRVKKSFDIDDIIVSEYGSTVVGLEMLRSENEEDATEKRRHDDVRSAIGTLSASEQDAIINIFDELGGMEGVLVASKIADSAGITRSVIVSALRKFESAGIIESRSSGMRGTYIKVVNDCLYDEMEKIGKED